MTSVLRVLDSYEDELPRDLAAAFWSEFGPNDELAKRLLKARELPPNVHAAIGAVELASVRIAWLTHPQTSQAAIDAAVEHEERISVLLALASSTVLSEAATLALWKRDIPRINGALLLNDALPPSVGAKVRGTILASHSVELAQGQAPFMLVSSVVQHNPDVAAQYLEAAAASTHPKTNSYVLSAAAAADTEEAWEHACVIWIDRLLPTPHPHYGTTTFSNAARAELLSRVNDMTSANNRVHAAPLARRIDQFKAISKATAGEFLSEQDLQDIERQFRNAQSWSHIFDRVTDPDADPEELMEEAFALRFHAGPTALLRHPGATADHLKAAARLIGGQNVTSQLSFPTLTEVAARLIGSADVLEGYAALLACGWKSFALNTTISRWVRDGVDMAAVAERSILEYGPPPTEVLAEVYAQGTVPLTAEAVRALPVSCLHATSSIPGSTHTTLVGAVRKVIDPLPPTVWPMLLKMLDTLPDDMLLGDAIDVVAELSTPPDH